ncbi:NADH-quinone oxidoreductase subunit J [candidate division KSB1 bacterium]
MEAVLFYIFGIFAVITAILVITQKNPIYSAIFLVLTLFSIAVLFLLLNAQFVAAVQVLVYAGAIMILFLFAVMLLNIKYEERIFSKLFGLKITSILISAILFFELIYVFFFRKGLGVEGNFTPEKVAETGNVELIGKVLYTKYLFPFEVASLVLLVAMIGVIVLAKKKF